MNEDFDNPNPDDQNSPNFRQLRDRYNETTAANKELESRVRKAEMKAAVAEAGIKMDPRTKFFLDHYDGDPDADAIQTALRENGFLEPETELVEKSEIEAHGQISDTQAGASAVGVNDDAHYEELRALYESAGPNVDPRLLSERATAIMQKYNQKVVTGDGELR